MVFGVFAAGAAGFFAGVAFEAVEVACFAGEAAAASGFFFDSETAPGIGFFEPMTDRAGLAAESFAAPAGFDAADVGAFAGVFPVPAGFEGVLAGVFAAPPDAGVFAGVLPAALVGVFAGALAGAFEGVFLASLSTMLILFMPSIELR